MLLKTLLLVLVAVIPVRVTTSEGDTLRGDFLGIGDAEILLGIDGVEKRIPFRKLTALHQDDVRSESKPSIRVTLHSGSEIAALNLKLSGETMTIEPSHQENLSIGLKRIRAVRFHKSSDRTTAWMAKLEEEHRSDTLAIQRGKNELDYIEGLVTEISDEKVTVKIDGDNVDAPIVKLEGILFGGVRTNANLQDIQISDSFGSKWSVAKLLPSQKDEALRLELSDDIIHLIPLSQVESIRFSGGMTMLASMPMAATEASEFVQTKMDRTMYESWFAPKADVGQDIVLFGNSSVEYRLDPGYRSFAAEILRDGDVRKATKASVRITMDDKVVWDQSIEGTTSFAADLPLNGARRLKIEVDAADDGDLGDKIRILRPRLLR